MRLSLSLAGLALVFAFAGCSTDKQVAKENEDSPNRRNPITGPFVGDDLYANIPAEKIKLNDDDVNFSGGKDGDPEAVAKWATERRDLITWLLRQEVTEINEFGKEEHRYKRVWPKGDPRPQTRFDQAVAIGTKVVEKIPDNTRERVRLAWCLFYKGSACYWGIDACMNRINILKTEIGSTSESDEKNAKFPKQSREIAELRDTAKGLKDDMFVYHGAALKHFIVYQNAMPMDKVPLDFMWKIHFELGDFRESVRIMNQLLDEDIVKEDVKLEYMKIRKEINDYLVEREINANAPKPGSTELLKRGNGMPGEDR